MARLPRLTVPGYPHHVIQRGNNRQPIVLSDADRETLLGLVADTALKHRVALHAYVLMDNHFHLLLTPETEDGVPQMMQAVGRRYVRYFNDLHHRSGTLWEGRYKSTLIQSESYLLACMTYMDLNPVRAGMVAQASDFVWSSHRHYSGLAQDRRLTPHTLYWGLGNTPFAREAAYAEMVRDGLSVQQQTRITGAALRGWALGDAGFVAELQKRTQRRVTESRPGRPVSQRKSAESL
ncbi:MAG: transposase [Hydrogenophaga sp.]|jgi:putative transposase|uniref:transposase n=1 Tax=Hydrogenophaga sp. TaxID=1904254 RepID=UPI0027183E66|nr:transposase [Hydrogenophaga sp.]MDZ4073617.1 transposase [Hylemonella sp.]MDO9483565.1 transposase [Hydrogenophaga sp.]MDP2221382.1 transposase [Hydrogenophaga sp.]MDP3343431.1 transposase [Hydrogenophaga sp.]MDP3806316.1 transposase [Hydrogenophaga sp.]